MEEKELVIQLKQGNYAAFDRLYEKYKNTALRMAYLIAGNQTDAEDIVQESFVKCYQHIKALKNDAGFRPWLYQILMRTAWQYCKKKQIEVPNEDVVSLKDSKGGASSLDLVIEKERETAMMEKVKELPVKHRMTIVLYYYNEMTTKEIAKILGCMEGTVKSRLFNARKMLKHAILEENKMLVGEENQYERETYTSESHRSSNCANL